MNFGKVSVPGVEGYFFYNAKEVIRIESDGNYSKLFLLSGKDVLTSRTLKHYERQLRSHGFFRVHSAHLINLNFINKYVKGRGGYIVMDDGATIDVSVRRREAFLRLIEEEE